MATGGNQTAGFTIIETMIVLAVSASLAMSVLALVSGRQNKTEFQIGANAMKQQFEQIINETRNGYYPTDGGFRCHGNNTPPVVDSSATPQGTNYDCIFLGKVITPGLGISGGDPETYTVYPMIAKRFIAGSSTVEARTFDQAFPIVLSPNSANNTGGVDYAVAYKTKSGMKLDHADYIVNGTKVGTNTFAAFALVDDLGAYTTDGTGNLNSATQSLNLFHLNLNTVGWPPVMPNNRRQTVDRINSGIDITNNVSAVELCYKSGGTDQSALITITGNGQLAVTLKIYGNVTCA